MKTLHTIYTNFAKRLVMSLVILFTAAIGSAFAAETKGTITFGTNNVKIDAASVSAQDNAGNTWVVATTGTTSYTQTGEYSQVGKKDEPAESITFTTVLPSNHTITSVEAKFGGFSSTAGNITIKVNGIIVGSGSLKGQEDVIVQNTSAPSGNNLTVSITDIDRGVKCYYISYTYEESGSSSSVAVTGVSLNKQTLSLAEGDSETLIATITPANASNKVVTWSSSAPSKASVDANGTVTAKSEGTAVITVSTADGNKTATCNVTVTEGSGGDLCKWTLVNDASTLQVGDQIVITSGTDQGKPLYAMSTTQNTNNRGQVAIDPTWFPLTIADDAQIITLEAGTKSGTFAFNVGNGYLYAASASANQLKTQQANNDNSSWTIEINSSTGVATIKAQGTNTRNWIRYNSTNIPPIFSCYASGQSDVQIYKNVCPEVQPETYTLTYDPNGATSGSVPALPAEYESGATVTVLGNTGNLAKEGHDFAGWKRSDNAQIVQAGNILDMPAIDLTLTAQWTPNQHTLTWDLVGGKVTVAGTNADVNATGTPSGNVAYGTSIQAPQVAKTGYTFNGWSPTFSVETTMPDNDLTYTAQWDPNTYTVQFNANGGTGTMGSQSFTYDDNPIALSANIFTRTGYNFAGWNTTADGTGTSYADKAEVKNLTAEPNGVVTLFAQWEEKRLTNFRTLCTYEIILDKNGGTTDGSALVTATKTALTAINPPIYAGRQIAGYYAESECNTLVADVAGNLQPNTQYTNANGGWTAGEVTLYPKWEAIEYTITWVVGGDKDKPFATTTASATTPLVLPDPAPTDDAIGCCADAFIGWSTKTNPTKAEVFNDVTNAPTITGDQTFHAVFATAAPGAGTSLLTFSEMGYANEEAVSSVTLGDGMGNGDATITFAKGTAATYAPTYYNIGEAVRTYAGNTITVEATYANTVLTQIDFAFAKGENTNAITASPGTITDGVWKGNAQSVTFTIGGDKGHRRIASIAVTTEVTGDQYTNYVTKCDLSGSASIGAGTITYAVGNAIEVKCGQRSPASKAATLTFASAQDLTCPVTIEASAGFLVSTNKNDNSKYASSITVKPVKTGANKGKLPTIYVRAEANFGVSGQMNGTITASGDEITTTQVNVVANVTCTQYTLTVVDHLGNTISTTDYYEGNEVAEIAKPTPDDCSKKYTFDGWSTEEVTYGSLIYNKVSFPFSMPAEDVTLYPVYICSKDYHRVTEDLGLKDLGADNWEGQYLIAANNTTFADGTTSNLAKASISEGFVENDVILGNRGDLYSISLITVERGYVLKTKDTEKPYVYITPKGESTITTETLNTAANNPLSVTYNSESDIVITNPSNTKGYALQFYSTRFGFYKAGGPVYLYKKYLYTTPLICGTIEAADAVVTSTAGQTIKVNVPVTLTSDLTRPNTIEKAVSDNPNFSVTALENAGQHTIAIGYTPTATTDGTETANITLTASNNATTTFQVTGRHLPENFVIAAKWGDNWYVLPADMNSESITEGLLIEVDNPADPIKAIAAPNTTKYGLKSVYTSIGSQDRYATHGERLVFVENVDETTPVANQTLYNGGGNAQNSTNTNIQVNAQYKTATGGYYETHPERYEWIPTTTDLKDYTLTSAHAFANEAARTVSLDNHGIFGTLLQDKSYNGMVRLLPVDNFYGPAELQVVEWKQKSVSVMYTGAGSKATTKVGSNEESDVQLLSDKNKEIDHAVYSLSTKDLTSATNQPLIITIKDDADAIIGAVKLTIPAIVATKNTSTALGVTEANAKATSIVVLDGATLTADATKYTYDDITVYPGGNLIIDDGKSLGMYTLTLRAGSSWGAEKYENKYPQLLVRGDYSNTSGQINLDYVTTQDYYYPLSVPEEVTIDDIKYPVEIYGSNVEKNNKGSFQLKYYDGAQRVKQGSQYGTGWVVVDESTTTTLTPNQGYAIWGIPKKINGKRQAYGIHRIPIKKAAADLITNETNDENIAIIAHGDASTPPNDRGWNYLGNPYLAGLGTNDDTDVQMGLLVQEMIDGKWTGGWVNNGEQVRYVTLTNDCQNFEALPVSKATILPFTTFFVQAAQTGVIALNAPTAVAAPASVVARRYAAQQVTAKEITTGIILTGNDQTDRTGLLIADNFTEEYEFNADLSKFENSGINLYTIGKTGNLAYMAINQALAEQPIPVGYTAPAEGLYTIAFDEDRYNATDISALYLIDYDSNEKTNLLHTDYSFVTAAGTNNQRFALQVAFAPANATNIEWVGDATVQVGVEGNTLMLNNLPTDAAVHVFDALGRLMYHAPTVPTEMQLTLPTGYYLVRIADKQHAVVIKTVIP